MCQLLPSIQFLAVHGPCPPQQENETNLMPHRCPGRPTRQEHCIGKELHFRQEKIFSLSPQVQVLGWSGL